jgi:hypothetical protein
VDRDNVVGIATVKGMDGTGVESQWVRDFPSPSRPAMWPTQPRVSFPGLEQPGNGAEHWPLSSVEVKETVEIHLYSPSESSWPVLGRNFKICFKSQYIIMCCSYTVITCVVCWFRNGKDEDNALIQKGCKVMAYLKATHSVHFALEISANDLIMSNFTRNMYSYFIWVNKANC